MSRSMSQNRQEIKEDEYPYSTSWFDIPEELREMIINEMDPKTILRFKQCSKLCAEEARRSKNSVYKIEINNTGKGTHICFHLTNENLECPHFRYSFSESGWGKWKTTTIRHEKVHDTYWESCDFSFLFAQCFIYRRIE
ncbi:unnamed protein product [Caenorhabditis angaria]|uniref:F-box domain-containing protein n=1 Tax=Caenorhabditis angaria TaxID=860376 RepID=A0A9P1I4Y9_9PELO|nr:unnamed protein product [Caenorhabditis angaria]